MSTVTQFGQFFRQRRKVLGLTLREFCRRNGFDPGNISRLERGLLRPPQSREVLDAYAKALKLRPDSVDWNTFSDLAAAETGRVPSQMLKNQAMREKLPKIFRNLQEQRTRQGSWTKAINLEMWAHFLDARARLPQLVRRLIHATVESLTHIEFPAGEGIQRPGWDGIVETPSGNAYVPSGISGWEIGVAKNPRQKAEEDFKNRVKNSRGLEPHQVSFIFVTPRKWTDKDEWSAEKNKLGIWKKVKVYDSADLEAWLETVPAVDVWCAQLLGQRPEGVTSIDEHWANLAALTVPSLKPEVFLASREDEVKALTQWLQSSPSALAFEARSPVEVIDFVAAYLAGLDEAQRDVMAARMLIVEEREAWSALAAANNRLVLIPRPSLVVEADMVAEAVRHGHHVLLCSHRFSTERADKRKLPLPYRYDLERALIASGFNEEEASRWAREAGGSLTVLKRRLARFASTSHPEWSRSPEAARLVPILLAGGWDDACAADRTMIEKLASRSYNEVLSVAQCWLNEEDPPIMRVLTHWSLVSREDSWLLLASNITRQLLDIFEEVVVEVLGEDDPQYELSPDERWQAALLNKRPKYSHQLRTGLAETLVLLAAKSDAIRDAVGPAWCVARVVQKLLPDDAGWQRWASLSVYLPLLAEACPDVFLDTIERDLYRSKPELLRLFNQERGPLFVSGPLTGLLWALETLAWEPSLLSRVSLALAHIAQLDPEERRENRSMNSLRRIFLPWRPQTTASVEQRIKVLKVVTKRLPDIGWQLLLSLSPTPHDVSTPTSRPWWRDWMANWSRGVITAEYWQQIEACTDHLLENAGDNVQRWGQLMEKFEHFPKRARDRLLQGLRSFDPTTFETEARRQIADVLRKKVSYHRYYSDANWAMSSETVDELEAIQKRFEPRDLVARYAWLFVAHWRLLAGSRMDSREKRDEAVFELRREALTKILAAEGLETVLELAKVAELPGSVGLVLGKAKLLDSDNEILPALLVSDNQNIATCAAGYSRGRFEDASWDWVERLPLAQWSVGQAGTFALVLPFERRTWGLVAQLSNEVSGYYWSHAADFCRGDSKEDVAYAVSMLLAHHRPFQAVKVLEMALHQKCEVDASLLMETLEAGLKREAQPEAALSEYDGYEIQELFERLQSDPNVDVQRLALLEWGYLGLLDGHGASPKALHGWLQRDPRVFAELLSMIYRSQNDPEDAVTQPTEEQKARAKNAHRLLRLWGTVPGTRDDGTVDEQQLLEWVKKARALCEESGRLEVCDIKIGEIFAHAPPESDGSWPCIPVRDIIEEVDSDELIEGFEIGIFNKRGGYSKSHTEGGEQERALAKQYAAYTDACHIEWPRTAAALRRVARRYEEEARREDERVQARF